jgi:hypothetical protein
LNLRRYRKDADVTGAVTSELASPGLPAADGDWGAVNLMNKAGATSWPIATFSYLYIRKVGRCRLTVSKPELKARLVSAISA